VTAIGAPAASEASARPARANFPRATAFAPHLQRHDEEHMGSQRIALGALTVLGALSLGWQDVTGKQDPKPAPARPAPQGKEGEAAKTTDAGPLPPSVEKALAWLARAQHQDGGFGGGSHSRQDVRDAHAVPSDPATTAVAAIAFLRAGSGLERGEYRKNLERATEYLLATIEAAKADGPQITELTGTQPQSKMGANVDTALAAQYLARLLQDVAKDAPLRPRIVKALDKCLHKIETSQGKDGNWSAGGWAPVLQSAQMCTALELGQLAGRSVDKEKLANAREYQKKQVGADGKVRADGAAGVVLYASAAEMRANAAQAKAAEDLVEEAKRGGRLEKDARVDEQTLRDLGVEAPQAASLGQAFQANTAAKSRAFDGRVLDGFGNNGGEEFLSYQMNSESLAIAGGEEWTKWRTMIAERLAKVQNQDGSWSGHHCITSPTFCTATAISCLTADRDVEWLRKTGKLAAQ
jgi:hypothetical protein